MRRHLRGPILLIAILLVPSVRAADAPKAPTIDDLLNLKTIAGSQISPDGQSVAYGVSESDFEHDAFVTQIWIARAGDVLVFTTHDLRLKARNLRRDPRASVTVFALDDPYDTVDIRGTVELVPDPDRALSIELTRKYTGEDPPPDPPGSSRLIARLTPARITGMVAS